MPTIAILGATGQTGTELVKQLLETDNKINVYARNAVSLHKKIPGLKSAKNANTFIGAMDDLEVMRDCLSDADIIISTIASNQNSPGCSIVTRASHAIVTGIKAGPERTTKSKPRLVLLSSATLNPKRIAEESSTIGYKFVYAAVGNCYDDLKRAIAYLEEQDCLSLTLAEPGALVHHKATGAELVFDEPGSELVPYSDLADAMIQIGMSERKDIKHVGIKVKGENQLGFREFLPLLRYLLPGLLATFFPWLWLLGKDYWPA